MPRRGARQATAEGPQNADQDVGLWKRLVNGDPFGQHRLENLPYFEDCHRFSARKQGISEISECHV